MFVYVRCVDYVALRDLVVRRTKWVALKVDDADATGAALCERIQSKLDWRVAQRLLAPHGYS